MANRALNVFQLTLRELFVLVIVAGVGIASLKLAGTIGASFVLIAILLFMAMAILSIVDRGNRQSFAIGFVLCTGIYIAIVWSSSGRELDPYDGKLPTSRLLHSAFIVIGTQTWIDVNTGQEVPNYDPSVYASATGGGGMFRGGPSVSLREVPDRETFMLIGHVLWALLFGYVGGKFAMLIYERRVDGD